MITLLITSICGSKDIGDFAPLEVGRTWTYQGFNNSGLISGTLTNSSEIRRTIDIKSKQVNGDTTSYAITVIDSIFNKMSMGTSLPNEKISNEILVKQKFGVLLPIFNLDQNENMLSDILHS